MRVYAEGEKQEYSNNTKLRSEAQVRARGGPALEHHLSCAVVTRNMRGFCWSSVLPTKASYPSLEEMERGPDGHSASSLDKGTGSCGSNWHAVSAQPSTIA